MLKNAFIIICLLISAFAEMAKAETDSNKIAIDSISRKQIGYLLNGEIDKYFSNISVNYTDLGGGPNGDGKVDLEKWKEKMEAFTSSQEFQKIKAQPIGNLLDLEDYYIGNYSESMIDMGSLDKFSFTLKKGDYVVYFSPKADSFLSDGWFAVFRKEHDTWKIIAGD
jgi:hypothetical protein